MSAASVPQAYAPNASDLLKKLRPMIGLLDHSTGGPAVPEAKRNE